VQLIFFLAGGFAPAVAVFILSAAAVDKGGSFAISTFAEN
jgi:hypothetical protein